MILAIDGRERQDEKHSYLYRHVGFHVRSLFEVIEHAAHGTVGRVNGCLPRPGTEVDHIGARRLDELAALMPEQGNDAVKALGLGVAGISLALRLIDHGELVLRGLAVRREDRLVADPLGLGVPIGLSACDLARPASEALGRVHQDPEPVARRRRFVRNVLLGGERARRSRRP